MEKESSNSAVNFSIFITIRYFSSIKKKKKNRAQCITATKEKIILSISEWKKKVQHLPWWRTCVGWFVREPGNARYRCSSTVKFNHLKSSETIVDHFHPPWHRSNKPRIASVRRGSRLPGLRAGSKQVLSIQPGRKGSHSPDRRVSR